MKICSLELENIRSYTKEHIDFPDGLILLSGDIGSGKSTILLAIEFALFGIQRGGMSGSGLLRHGAQQGIVTLTCMIADETIIISRTLKRTPKGATQEPGTITINDQQTTYTATELKSRILELLNYPQDILQRDALYRYTVYTPQEEMKAILSQRPDERLALLRKLFSIDKYQRVRENTQELIREYKAQENKYLGKIEGLTSNLQDHNKLKVMLAEQEQLLAKINSQITIIRNDVQKSEQSIKSYEKARFECEDFKRQIALLHARSTDLTSQHNRTEQERSKLQEQIKSTAIEEQDVDILQLAQLKQKYAQFQQKLDEKNAQLLKQQALHHSTITNATALANQITKLDTCPTCKQQVNEQHKDHIISDSTSQEQTAKKILHELATIASELAKKQRTLIEKKEELLQKERQVEANKVKLQNLKYNQERLEFLNKTIIQLQKDVKDKQEEIQLKSAQLAKIAFDEDIYSSLSKEHTMLMQQERTLLIQQTTKQKDIEQLTKTLQDIELRLEQKNRTQVELQKNREQQTWLSKHLLSISQLAERAIFLSIYTIFNDYFRQWLSTLLEDETLFCRLDSDFTPIITQNEHETSIDYLSGGERTSLALAYRLALNKVINEFLTHFKTRNLLILDEPTDGFSSEQLERVREVLEQLHMAQIIIVSHEQQMEGYVDHVIRIQKQGHESKVVI